VFLEILTLSNGSIYLQFYDFEEGRSEEILIPGNVLVRLGPFFGILTVEMLRNLVLKDLTQINQDSIALSYLCLSMHQKWNLSQWVHLQELIRPSLLLNDIFGDEFMLYFTDPKQSLDCSSRLTAQIPKKN
jgi:hypothetical protein